VRVISKVADAYKLNKKSQRQFKKTGSIAYDDRILYYKLVDKTVSIWTIDGRLKLSFLAGPKQLVLLQTLRGEANLVLRKGNFFLFQTCEVPEPPGFDPDDFLGIDFGVVNIAVDSDAEVFSGSVINNIRSRNRALRQKLQKKGTKSAKRLLKNRSKKEALFARHINHCVSKELVAKAERTSRGIAIEDLKGIRKRIRARKPQRSNLHSWSFFQLRRFLEYKAKRAGVLVQIVDPRNSSRECPACGHIDKRNRKSQAEFSCIQCGNSGLADYFAALNLRNRGRAAINRPNVAQCLSVA
jgi:IS605 OrfB family transposase